MNEINQGVIWADEVRRFLQLGSIPDAELRDDPYPFYHRWRGEDPVHKSQLGPWIVTRYEDAARILRNPRWSREDPTVSARAPAGGDPPGQSEMRGVIARAFSPRAAEQWRDRVRAIAAEQIDAVAERGQMDLLAEFAYPLAMTVTCELLGIPIDAQFNHLAMKLAAHMVEAMEPRPRTQEVHDRDDSSVRQVSACMREFVNQRRTQPGDDLLSRLVAIQAGGEQPTTDELVAACILLHVAGQEPTAHLITNAMLVLLRHPDQLQRLRRDPSLIPGAVEECLRYDSPTRTVVRTALSEITIGGRTIPAGDAVVVVVGAANRDPEMFDDPDRFDVCRTPNEHIAFGAGSHHCIGTALSRVEAQEALAALIHRLPGLSLASDTVEWRNSFVLRAVKRLPVFWSSR